MSKSTVSKTETTSSLISNIRKALALNEEERNNSSNLETSKVSNDSTTSESSSVSKEKETNNIQLNDYYNSFEEIKKNLALSYPQSPFEKNKKLLILDLDETLAHSDLDFSLQDKIQKYDTILHFNSDEEKNIPIPLLIRPWTKEFLDYAVQEFDLVIFTASDKQYANEIIDFIEKDKKYFKMRLYRNHCLFIEPGLYIKDLRIFSDFKKIEDIIILDNSLFSFANQLNNGILITSFFYDLNDSFLENVKCYLEYIKNEKDIRLMNKESFRFEEIKEDIIRNDN